MFQGNYRNGIRSTRPTTRASRWCSYQSRSSSCSATCLLRSSLALWWRTCLSFRKYHLICCYSLSFVRTSILIDCSEHSSNVYSARLELVYFVKLVIFNLILWLSKRKSICYFEWMQIVFLKFQHLEINLILGTQNRLKLGFLKKKINRS